MLHCNASNTGCVYCTKKLLKIQGLRDRARERERERSHHFFQKSVAIFSKLDITGSSNKPATKSERIRERERKRKRCVYIHFDGAFGAEVGLEDILQAFGGGDVHVKCCRFVQHLRVWIQPS